VDGERKPCPFGYFDSSSEVIRLTAMPYMRHPLSLRNVEDLLHEHGIDICHETVRFWWNRFGPLLSVNIRKGRVMFGNLSCWRWHAAEVFVKVNGKLHYLWPSIMRVGCLSFSSVSGGSRPAP
jgi:putative transposase